MADPRTVLVVNPNSQGGSLGRRWPELSALVRRHLVSFEEVQTSGPGDATRLTRELLRDGADRIVAIGGDGTINEVVNGFFDDGEAVAPEAHLGVIPFGTGGDFRKSLRLRKDVESAAEILAEGKTRLVDVGRIDFKTRDGVDERRMFINIASFGISGMVDRLVNDASKRLGGRLSFLVATARAGMRYKNQRVRLVFDGDEQRAVDTTINTVAVANGQYFGGGMHIAPKAELDDGLFDVVALGDFSAAQMAIRGWRVYQGSHLNMDKVSYRRASQVRAEPLGDDPVELDVDGETPGILPATFTLVPSALQLVVPY